MSKPYAIYYYTASWIFKKSYFGNDANHLKILYTDFNVQGRDIRISIFQDRMRVSVYVIN